MKQTVLAMSLVLVFSAHSATAAQPTVEDKIDILQKEIDELKAKTVSPSAGVTTVGGYGEINYNSRTITEDNTADNNRQMDLRRFVIFLGHKFNDDLRFYSELEVEHGVVSKDDQGETELEQAFIDYRLNGAANLKAGLLLMPLGILNETHEPPTFYGVERNFVETLIIPSTWREGGVGVYGEIGQGLHYDVGVTTGFDAGKMDNPNTGVASAHQELQLAKANDLSAYGALNYLGVPGLRLGGGVFTGDTGQDGASNPLLKGISARLTLWDLHGQYRAGDLDLQAVYARGTLGDADKVSIAQGIAAPKAFFGWYGQAAYHVWRKGDLDLAPFVRYEHFNTQEEVADGFTADPLNNETVTTAGVNFKIHPQVVFKADYQKFKTDSKKDRFDLGMGYMF